MKTEKNISALSGALLFGVWLIITGVAIVMFVKHQVAIGVLLAILFVVLPAGFVVINPNESMVLILFGTYKGSLRQNGFFWVNPFMTIKKISLRAQNFDSPSLKVNDKIGNPIQIGSVLVWRVEDTFKACFEVDSYKEFIKIQSESAIRKLAGLYPYDNFEHENEPSLRSGGEEVNHQLEKELTERLQLAGIKVMEARISNLSYAQEIAGAMLQRQQAIAVVAARQKIVEGAVGMVEAALHKIAEKELVEMDPERKAAMISNLMVVLCSDRSATPVINAGTLHH